MLQKITTGHWPIFLLSSFSSAGNMFLPIILVRILAPEDVGLYKIFFLHFMALPFLFLAGGPFHSVFYWVGKGEKEAPKFLNATLVLTIILSSLILLVGYPFKSFISQQLGLPEPYVVLLLLAGALCCPSGHYAEASIAKGHHARGSIFDTIFEVLKTIGFIFIAYHYKSLYFVFIFYVLLLTTKLIVGIILNFKNNQIHLRAEAKHLKGVIKYCSPVAIMGLLGFFVDKVDLLILSSFLDMRSYAFYSMGCLLIPPLFLLEMSVQKILIPSLSRNYNEKNSNEASRAFRKGISNIAFLIIPSIFGLITFAQPIISLLYTDEYLDSVIYLQIFALSYLFLIFPHDAVPRASGKTGWILKTYIVLTPITLISVFFGAKYLGAVGVLIITLIMKCVPKILGLFYSREIMHWTWSEMFPFRKLLFFIMTSGVLSIISLILRPYFSRDLDWFLVCGSQFALCYLGCVHFTTKKVQYGKA